MHNKERKRESVYPPKAWFGGIAEAMPLASEQSQIQIQRKKESLNFWKFAVAPQQGEIADCANELMRRYAQHTPGSKESSKFLLSLVRECRERIRSTLLPSADRDNCSIEFVPNMCRGLEIALCRIKGLSRIILSPFEHPSVLAVAGWLSSIIKADVCQLHFEAADYLLSRSEQEKKLVSMIQDKLQNNGEPTALVLSAVSYATGLSIQTEEIISRLHEVDDSSLYVILDGAHAAGNCISDVDIRKYQAYVISVHKWLLSPEPCGVIITPRSVSDEETPYDAWSRSYPATTANVRVFTSLVSSLRAIDRVGLENWHAHSVRLRDYFIKRMHPRLSVIGYDTGMEMTSFIAVCPGSGYRWKWQIEELEKFLEQHSVYLLMLSVDPSVPWMRIAFPYTLHIQQVDELCDVLNNSLE